MHVEIPRPRDAIKLNNDGMIKLGDVYYQTEPSVIPIAPGQQLSRRRLKDD